MTQTTTRPVGVDELLRAWSALQDGQFRARAVGHPRRQPTSPRQAHEAWASEEPTVPVIGCAGGVGASTLAVALATAASPARVLECCTATATGLATAATAELGTEDGWALGRREQVWLARTTTVMLAAAELPQPCPSPAPVALTVVDVGWDVGQVLAADGWLGNYLQAAHAPVVVTTATVPGLRRLEATLTLLHAQHPLIAYRGPARRRWPGALVAATGPLTRAAIDHGRAVAIPEDKRLALRGLDSAPLPPALLKTAETLLRLTAAGTHPQKGTIS